MKSCIKSGQQEKDFNAWGKHVMTEGKVRFLFDQNMLFQCQGDSGQHDAADFPGRNGASGDAAHTGDAFLRVCALKRCSGGWGGIVFAV